MNIIYISYWGVNDGLTRSTVLPHLRILEESDAVYRIFLVTFERGEFKNDIGLSKVVHRPIIENKRLKGVNKVMSFIQGWRIVKKIVSKETISLVLCRSVFAGILGVLGYKRFGIPFVVESYEPHVDYMEEVGEWQKGGVKSRILRNYDQRCREYAFKLFPVSNEFKNELINQGVSEDKIQVLPCGVDLNRFKFSIEKRREVRQDLGILNSEKVGIYLGKFGGIYLKEEAFDLFSSMYKYSNMEFRLIILTPDDEVEIKQALANRGIPLDRVIIKMVPHNVVNQYLSAADFAFSTIKPSENRKYSSPIKNGEYWASGLPIISPKGIGDDDKIIESNRIGIVYNVFSDSLEQVVSDVDSFMEKVDSRDGELSKRIYNIAIEKRSFRNSEKAYQELLQNIDHD